MLNQWILCANTVRWRERQVLDSADWSWFLHPSWGVVKVQMYHGQHQVMFNKLLGAMKLTQVIKPQTPKLVVTHGQGPWGWWQEESPQHLHFYDIEMLYQNEELKKSLWQMIKVNQLDGR